MILKKERPITSPEITSAAKKAPPATPSFLKFTLSSMKSSGPPRVASNAVCVCVKAGCSGTAREKERETEQVQDEE